MNIYVESWSRQVVDGSLSRISKRQETLPTSIVRVLYRRPWTFFGDSQGKWLLHDRIVWCECVGCDTHMNSHSWAAHSDKWYGPFPSLFHSHYSSTHCLTRIWFKLSSIFAPPHSHEYVWGTTYNNIGFTSVSLIILKLWARFTVLHHNYSVWNIHDYFITGSHRYFILSIMQDVEPTVFQIVPEVIDRIKYNFVYDFFKHPYHKYHWTTSHLV